MRFTARSPTASSLHETHLTVGCRDKAIGNTWADLSKEMELHSARGHNRFLEENSASNPDRSLRSTHEEGSHEELIIRYEWTIGGIQLSTYFEDLLEQAVVIKSRGALEE